MTAQTMIAERKTVGPSSYKLKDSKKILGVYKDNADNVSHIDSHVFVKKAIPAPDKYDGRGKSMSKLSKERCDKIRYVYDKSHGTNRIGKIIKDDNAGPGTYKVAEALQNSAAVRSSI